MRLKELLDMDVKDYGFVKSGILGVDAIVGGYARGELTILCAPTSGGKSLISLNSALVMSEKASVLYVSCENSLVDDKKRIEENIEKYNLDIDNMAFEYVNMDYTNVALNELEELIENSYCDAVFVDSIDFIAPDASSGSELYQSYGAIAKALRMLGRKYEVAVITTAQINRQGYDKGIEKMSVADIADSIKIARQAHDVWCISKDEAWAMKVIKHRGQLKVNKETFAMTSPKFNIFNITQVFRTDAIGATLDYREAKELAGDE